MTDWLDPAEKRRSAQARLAELRDWVDLTRPRVRDLTGHELNTTALVAAGALNDARWAVFDLSDDAEITMAQEFRFELEELKRVAPCSARSNSRASGSSIAGRRGFASNGAGFGVGEADFSNYFANGVDAHFWIG